MREILSGKDVTTLSPRTGSRAGFHVDAQAMKHWGLKQGNLPPGSTVLFHQPSLWEQNRLLVSATAAIVVFQSAIVAGLLFQRRRRRQAENSLRDSEDRMSFAAVSASIGLWQFDRATEKLWAAEPCREILGFAKNTPVTLDTFLAAAHPDDRHILLDTLQKSKGERSAGTDIRIVQPNGELRWVRIRARAYVDGQGAPNQLSGMFVDVTEQKTAESEAELQRQEVAHLTRVTVLGELSGAIAHEVNQPLTAILSNAQAALHLLAPETPNYTEIRGALEDIVQEDNRAGDIIQRLRGLLKKGEGKFESVDLNKLVEATIALLRHEVIARRISVETELAASLPPVLGDSVQLQQVLLNLIMNAMDAMVSTPDALRQIKIWTRVTTAGTVEVSLKDRGPGIESADSKRVFVPFYTTKDHGLGLGLSICSTIIEKHGGKIELRNDEAGGALAAFSLPGAQRWELASVKSRLILARKMTRCRNGKYGRRPPMNSRVGWARQIVACGQQSISTRRVPVKCLPVPRASLSSKGGRGSNRRPEAAAGTGGNRAPHRQPLHRQPRPQHQHTLRHGTPSGGRRPQTTTASAAGR